jgi:dihydroneopterin aldolase
MGKIMLERMEFFSYHGCFREEQIIGAKYLVDLVVDTDTSRAELSDRLHDTINYTLLYSIVKEEMENKSYLIEHVAFRIMERLKRSFGSLTSVELKISKINPPVGGRMEAVSFQKEWKK